MSNLPARSWVAVALAAAMAVPLSSASFGQDSATERAAAAEALLDQASEALWQGELALRQIADGAATDPAAAMAYYVEARTLIHSIVTDYADTDLAVMLATSFDRPTVRLEDLDQSIANVQGLADLESCIAAPTVDCLSDGSIQAALSSGLDYSDIGRGYGLFADRGRHVFVLSYVVGALSDVGLADEARAAAQAALREIDRVIAASDRQAILQSLEVAAMLAEVGDVETIVATIGAMPNTGDSEAFVFSAVDTLIAGDRLDEATDILRLVSRSGTPDWRRDALNAFALLADAWVARGRLDMADEVAHVAGASAAALAGRIAVDGWVAAEPAVAGYAEADRLPFLAQLLGRLAGQGLDQSVATLAQLIVDEFDDPDALDSFETPVVGAALVHLDRTEEAMAYAAPPAFIGDDDTLLEALIGTGHFAEANALLGEARAVERQAGLEVLVEAMTDAGAADQAIVMAMQGDDPDDQLHLLTLIAAAAMAGAREGVEEALAQATALVDGGAPSLNDRTLVNLAAAKARSGDPDGAAALVPHVSDHWQGEAWMEIAMATADIGECALAVSQVGNVEDSLRSHAMANVAFALATPCPDDAASVLAEGFSAAHRLTVATERALSLAHLAGALAAVGAAQP